MASPTATGGSVAVNSTAGTSCEITPPTMADGDVLYAAITRAVAVDTVSLSGWTIVTSQDEDYPASGTGNVTILRKVIVTASGEPSTYTFTWSTSSRNLGHITRVRGADNTTPEAASPVPAQSTDANPNPPASGTLTSADYLSYVVSSIEGKNNPATEPTGYTLEGEDGTAGGGSPTTHCAMAVATKEWTGTSEDPGTFTANGSDDWAACHVVIAPPPSQTLSPGLESQLVATFTPGIDIALHPPPAAWNFAWQYSKGYGPGGLEAFGPDVSLSSGTQQIDPALESQLAAPFAPTFAREVTPSLESQLVSTFAPTFARTIDPGLETQLVTPFDPTLTTGAVTLSPGLVSQLVAAFDPTITIGPVTLSPGLRSQLVAAFGPTVTTGPVTISPALQSQLVAAFAPTFARIVDPALQSQLVTPFAPSFTITVTPGLASQLATSFDPTLTTGAVTVSPGLASQLAAAFAPSLAINLTPGPASQLVTTFAPSFTITVIPGLQSQLAAAFNPTVTTGGGVQQLDPALQSQLVAAFDPTLTTGAVTLSPGLVSQLAAAFDPTLTTGAVTLSPGLVSQLVTPFAPTFSITVIPGLVSQLATAFGPALTTGAVTLSPDLVSQLISPFAPIVQGASSQQITPALVSQLIIPFSPLIRFWVFNPTTTTVTAVYVWAPFTDTSVSGSSSDQSVSTAVSSTTGETSYS